MKRTATILLALAFALPADAAKHWLYSAEKQMWATDTNKFRINDWTWGDAEETQKLICVELKAPPDLCWIRWVPAAYDTSGAEWTEITYYDETEKYYVDMLEEVTFTTGGDNLAQGTWAPRSRYAGWKWLRLTNADADSQELPRGMLMVPAAYDTAAYTEDSEATIGVVVDDINQGQYGQRGKKKPNKPTGINVTPVHWAGVRQEPASVSFQGSADAPDETDSSITWTHTTTSGSDLGFTVLSMSAASGSNKTVNTITFNGDSMSKYITFVDGNVEMSMWKLSNPDVGAYSVVMTRTGSGFVWTACSYAWEGADQTDLDDGTDTGSGTSSTSSVTITVGANDAAIADMSMYWDTPNQTASDGQTIIRQFPDSGPGIHVVWGYKTSISSGSNTHRYTHGSEDWLMAGGAIKASVWLNENERGAWHSVTLCRLYKDGDDWKQTESFNRDDLLVVGKVADQAHTWICEQVQQPAKAG